MPNAMYSFYNYEKIQYHVYPAAGASSRIPYIPGILYEYDVLDRVFHCIQKVAFIIGLK